MTNHQLILAVNNYKNTKENYDELHGIFVEMATAMHKHLKFNFSLDKSLDDIIHLCFSQLENCIDTSRSFNFFTTIIACFFRQLNRKMQGLKNDYYKTEELKLLILEVKEYFCNSYDSEQYIWSIIQEDGAYYVDTSYLAALIRSKYGDKLKKLSTETNSWFYKNEIVSLENWLKIYNPKPPLSSLCYSPCIWDDIAMKHKAHILSYQGTMQNLVDDIGDLRYDALAEFFDLLSKKIAKDSVADMGRNRPKLAGKLNEVAVLLSDAKLKTDEIWDICFPRMVD